VSILLTKSFGVFLVPWISWHNALEENCLVEIYIGATYFILFLLKRQQLIHMSIALNDFSNLKQCISVNCSKIVLVAILDDGSEYVSPALNALKRLGAKDPILVAWRGSFAFAGYAESNKPSWVTQEQHKRYKGPSIISLIIPHQSRQTGKKYITVHASVE